MKDSGLTEKKMSNKRFRSTEQAIFTAYFEFQDSPNAKILAHRAKVSRSTLYRHHQIPYKIPRDYEIYLLKKYTRKIRRLLAKDTNLKTIFCQILVFVSINREIFQALFENDSKGIIKQMLGELKIKISRDWETTNNLDKLYNIYTNEILGIIEIWAKHNFNDAHFEMILSDIVYLTKTAPYRLSCLK